MSPSTAEAVGSKPESPARGDERVELLIVGSGPMACRVAQAARDRSVQAMLVRPSGHTELPAPIHFPTLWRLVDQAGGDRLGWPEIVRRARAGTVQDASDDAARPPVSVAEGVVRFAGPDCIELDGRPIRFRRAVLAAERTAVPLESPGAEECQYLSEATLEDNPNVPASLAILGAGAEACQWAQVFQRLESQVHLVCPGGRLLPAEDPEITSLLQSQLAATGIRLHLDTAPATFARMGNRKAVLLGVGDQQRKLLVDEVLYLGPKRWSLAGLGLEAAGVATEDGQVRVDPHLRASNRRILVAVSPDEGQPWCVADLAARIAVSNAVVRFAGWPWCAKLRVDLVPRCLHTRPQVIQIGLPAVHAAAQPERFAVHRAELTPGPGFLKLVVARVSGRIAGATVCAPSTDPWLAPLAILMDRRLPLRTVSGLAVCDCSLLEPLLRIAEQAARDRPEWRERLARVFDWRRRIGFRQAN